MRYRADNSESTLLTVKEVSTILKLSEITIYKYIREQKLDAFEFGGHFRISRVALDKFIRSHKIAPSKLPEKKGEITNE